METVVVVIIVILTSSFPPLFLYPLLIGNERDGDDGVGIASRMGGRGKDVVAIDGDNDKEDHRQHWPLDFRPATAVNIYVCRRPTIIDLRTVIAPDVRRVSILAPPFPSALRSLEIS